MFERKELGSLIDRHSGGGTPGRQVPGFWNGSIPWASVKDFKDGQISISRTEEYISEEGLRSSASNLIPENTVIICSRMAVGRAALSEVPIAINQDLKALFPRRGVNERYLLRVLHWIKERAENLAVGSTVKGIRVADLLGLEIPIAPDTEQPAIANTLDTLDTQIRQTEAIIAKLQQVKQGLLHDLLTRGIDANGQLRPPREQAPELYKASPLGWIPREWEVCSIRDLAEDLTGGAAIKTFEFTDSGVGVIAKADVTNSKYIDISNRTQFVSESVAEAYKSSLVASDAVIISLRDLVPSGPTVGMASLFSSEKRFLLAQGTYGLYLKKHLLMPSLFAEYTRQPFFRELVKGLTVGSTQVHVRSTEYFDLQVRLPPFQEQQDIDNKINGIDKRQELEAQKLEKLKKQKSGLMDDLLTGRVRVNKLLKSA